VHAACTHCTLHAQEPPDQDTIAVVCQCVCPCLIISGLVCSLCFASRADGQNRRFESIDLASQSKLRVWCCWCCLRKARPALTATRKQRARPQNTWKPPQAGHTLKFKLPTQYTKVQVFSSVKQQQQQQRQQRERIVVCL
jgi:hypothetical protein